MSTSTETKKRIAELALLRDAYQLMEEGIKKLEEYNRLIIKINQSTPEKQWKFLEVHPVIFRENASPDVRTSGIYLRDINGLTSEIIKLNEQLRAEFIKRGQMEQS